MEGSSSSESGSADFLEKLITAFSTDKGSSLLTLAIGVACKSSTTAWCEHQARQDAASAEAGRPDSLQRLFDFAGALSLKPPASRPYLQASLGEDPCWGSPSGGHQPYGGLLIR